MLQPGRKLRAMSDGLLSALPPGARGSSYDGRAAMYDRLVSNRIYDRLVWGSSPADYAAFAATAAAAADGPLLDAGCGTAVFTATAYRDTERPIVLVDRSIGMLTRAAKRLRAGDGDPARITFVQADLFDLPFLPGAFSTVACFGVLHVVEDIADALCSLRGQLSAGGSLYATSLVAGTAYSRSALRLLHRLGEAASPRTESELVAVAHRALGETVRIRHDGSMAYLTANPGPTR
jgi:SAM-dependent methyltransferase